MKRPSPKPLALLLATGLLLGGCHTEEAPKQKPGPRAGMQQAPVAVAFAPVEARDLIERLPLTGTLEATRQVALAPRTSGRLATVTVELGDAVAAGQVVARLDDVELRTRLAQAEAALASARATLRQREIDLDHRATLAKRDQELFTQDFIARQEMESSQAQAEGARAMLALARAELARAEAARREAQEALVQAAVTAPMAGVVAERLLDPGAMSGPAQPVVTLVAPGSLKTVVAVGEAVLPRLKPGASATVQVDAFPGRVFAAKVKRVAPVIARETRTGPVELEVADAEGALKPGMFARVELRLSERPQAPAVPRMALVQQQGRQGVFVAEDGKARFVPVTTGLADGDFIEVRQGLSAGQRVITLGNHLLRDGAPVQAEATSAKQAERTRRGSD